jgi:hypothetical protein
VTQILVAGERGLMYDLCFGEKVTTHHELEIDSEVNEAIKVQ